MVAKIDKIAFDYQTWKNEGGYNDGIPPIAASIMDAINAGLQFAFEAGWTARDQRSNSTLGKQKEVEQSKGREGLGTKDERHATIKLRTTVASKGRHKKRRVSD